MYINTQQIQNSHRIYAHKCYLTNNFNGVISGYTGVSHWEGYEYEEYPDDIMEAPLSELFCQGKWKCFVDPMVSRCKVNGKSNFSPLLNGYVHLGKLRYGESEPDLIFPWLATTPMLVLEVLIANSILALLLGGMIITRKERTCLHILLWSSIFGDSSKDFHHSCQTKPVHSRKHFQQCSSPSDCYCNECKLCIHWILYWKLILVSTIWSPTN